MARSVNNNNIPAHRPVPQERPVLRRNPNRAARFANYNSAAPLRGHATGNISLAAINLQQQIEAQAGAESVRQDESFSTPPRRPDAPRDSHGLRSRGIEEIPGQESSPINHQQIIQALINENQSNQDLPNAFLTWLTQTVSPEGERCQARANNVSWANLEADTENHFPVDAKCALTLERLGNLREPVCIHKQVYELSQLLISWLDKPITPHGRQPFDLNDIKKVIVPSDQR